MQPYQMSEKIIDKVYQGINNGTYRFKPVRTKLRKKSNGKYRKLGIFCMDDLVYLTTTANSLEVYTNDLHTPAVHSYIKGRGVDSAIDYVKLTRLVSPYVLVADIKDAFDNVRLDALMVNLYNSTIPLKTAKAVREIVYSYTDNGIGITQGSPLSPALFNLYLRDFDFEYSTHRTNLQYPRYVRYSDNFLYFGSELKTLERIAQNMKDKLKTYLGLDLNTTIVMPQTEYKFLGKLFTTPMV